MNTTEKTDIYRIALQALARLPLPLLRGLGWCIGSLPIKHKLHRLSVRNLERCFPHLSSDERKALNRANLRHAGMALAESLPLWFGAGLPQDLINPHATDTLKAAHQQGKGVILLCPHWGAWEAAGLFCSTVLPMTTLYKPQRGVMDALIKQGRERFGAKLVPTDSQGVRQVLSALKQGEAIGILPDHDPPDGTGVFAPFFGLPAHTMDLVAKLAARSGAPVLFCTAERVGWRGYRLAVFPATAAIYDPAHSVAAMNAQIEGIIQQDPAQYWWGYARFRHQPEGADDFYQGVL